MPRAARVTSKWRRSERKRLRYCVECHIPFPSTDSSNRTCAVCLKREAESRARPHSLDSERREFLGKFLDNFDEGFVSKYRENERDRDKERSDRQKKISERRLKENGGS